MKILKCSLFLILTFLMFSCSKGDDQDPNEHIVGLLKKIESKSFKKEIFYSQSKLINEIRISSSDLSFNYVIKYKNDKVVTITQNYKDFKIEHNVTYENNEIILTPTTDNSRSNTIIFQTNAGFVDSRREYFSHDPDTFFGEQFTRNSNNNIELIELISNDVRATSKWHYVFSSFENKVKLDPNYNPVFDMIGLSYYKILNLKISNENPLEYLTYLDNEIYEEGARFIEFIYSDNGIVSKGVLHRVNFDTEYYFDYY